jgi:hypothetical protein
MWSESFSFDPYNRRHLGSAICLISIGVTAQFWMLPFIAFILLTWGRFKSKQERWVAYGLLSLSLVPLMGSQLPAETHLSCEYQFSTLKSNTGRMTWTVDYLESGNKIPFYIPIYTGVKGGSRDQAFRYAKQLQERGFGRTAVTQINVTEPQHWDVTMVGAPCR